jgi:hypothetical protein
MAKKRVKEAAEPESKPDRDAGPTLPYDCGYWDADNLLRAFGRAQSQVPISEVPPSDALMGALCNLAAQRTEDVAGYWAGWDERCREAKDE